VVACESSEPPDGSAPGGNSCSSVCAKEPTCPGVAATNCSTECESLETQCAAVGKSTEFQSFLDCAATATFTCTSTGATTSSCGTQAEALGACSAVADSGFPDTANGFPDSGNNFPDSGNNFPDSGNSFPDSGVGSDTGSPPVDAGPPACLADMAFTAVTWAAPTALHQNKCTAALITAYQTSLQAGGSTATSGNAACDACLQTDMGAAAHGPIITQSGSPIEINYGGCIADLDGSKAAGSCGNTVNNENDCIDEECSTCSDFSSSTQPITMACVQDAFAAGGPCAGAANEPTTACQTELMASADQTCLSVQTLLTAWCGM